MLEERNAKDDEKDWMIANLQAQLEYFKQKLFGSSSAKRNDLPGQLSLFSDTVSEEEPVPELIEPEFIEFNTGKKKRKLKASFDEMFANLPVCRVEVDSLTEEQKRCPVCQSRMIPIGQEEIWTEIRYTRAKLEHFILYRDHIWMPSLQRNRRPAVHQRRRPSGIDSGRP